MSQSTRNKDVEVILTLVQSNRIKTGILRLIIFLAIDFRKDKMTLEFQGQETI